MSVIIYKHIRNNALGKLLRREMTEFSLQTSQTSIAAETSANAV